MALRTVLYLVFLMWLFSGVAIVSDIFMAAIEAITSNRATVVKDGHEFKVRVWNDTVANLTLMALGSSAPEILLSIIELLGAKMYAGALGPGTIVGSAAFNLLVISAICLGFLPKNETRQIRQLSVFYITATCSVAAYLWLIVILQVTSPNVVTPVEGLITFLGFPVMVCSAYYADIGGFKKFKVAPGTGGGGGMLMSILPKNPESSNVDKGDVARQLLKDMGSHSDAEAHVAKEERSSNHSRAVYRIEATRNMFGGKRISVSGMKKAAMQKLGLSSKVFGTKKTENRPVTASTAPTVTVHFDTKSVMIAEDAKEATLMVSRDGDLNAKATVGYATVAGSAKEGEDFEKSEGTLVFDVHETHKEIKVTILHSKVFEALEKLSVVLSDANGCSITAGKDMCEIVIEDANSVGVLSFGRETMAVKEDVESGCVLITVKRSHGSKGEISCQYSCEEGAAKANEDYIPKDGTITFAEGELMKTFEIPIINDNFFEFDEDFYVKITNPTGGATFPDGSDGGNTGFERLKVVIISDDKISSLADRMVWLAHVDRHEFKLQAGGYLEQFKVALDPLGDAEVEEGEERGKPSVGDWITHIITLPFKFMFAFIPPTSIGGGWPCFCIALCFIGGVTAVIGDVAALLGCTLNMKASSTAITIVALGTSLPDTFASQSAALHEKYADNSIGNITGSNSVNVFLGLGMPWLLGAMYWSQGWGGDAVTAEWTARFIEEFPDIVAANPGGAFIVAAGDLAFSVTIFCICALICLGTIVMRRKVLGYELGGDPKTAKLTAFFFVALWLFYITMSILKSDGHLG